MTTATQPATSIEGIVPVMLTPFDDTGAIDYAGLERLIEWYMQHGADALFAVAQSSEMQFLSLAERAHSGASSSRRWRAACPSWSPAISATIPMPRPKSCGVAASGAQGSCS